MKSVLLKIALFLFSVLAVVFLLKVAQKICWDSKVSFMAPPSLDSWDPSERIEAARQAVKKFGGKE